MDNDGCCQDDTMETAMRPQLSDLRQKRLAYFDQLNPKTSTKTSLSQEHQPTINQEASRKNGSKTDKHVRTANNLPSRAISKPHCRTGLPNGNGSVGTSSNTVVGTSYEQVTALKNVNQKTNAEEFRIAAPDCMDRQFSLKRAEEISEERSDQRVPLSPNSLETASTNYEMKFRNHLRKQDCQGMYNQIRSHKSPVEGNLGSYSNADLGNRKRDQREAHPQNLCEDQVHRDRLTDEKHCRGNIESDGNGPSQNTRAEQFRRFVFQQGGIGSNPAVEASADHSAFHAESILQQMSHVRQFRSQVHGELIASFSDQLESRSRPTVERVMESKPTGCLKEEASSSYSIPSQDLNAFSKNEGDAGNNLAFKSSHEEAAESNQPEFNGVDNVDSVDKAEFDLGALQEAAKQGDDILRQYIQSLSKNLKQKRILEAEKSSLQTKGSRQDNESLNKISEVVSPSETCQTGSDRKSTVTEYSSYVPKVSKPKITSDELEKFGLFGDPKYKGENCKESDRTWNEFLDPPINGNHDNLGLSTHRPSHRPYSPLQQVLHNGEQLPASSLLLHGRCNSVSSPDDNENQGDLAELGLSTHRGNTESQLSKEIPEESQPQLGRHYQQGLVADNSHTCIAWKPVAGHEELFNPWARNNIDILTLHADVVVPVPHPLGTEIGNFVFSEQSTDSNQDQLHIVRSTASASDVMTPVPPSQEHKRTTSKFRKTKRLSTAREKTLKSPRTTEQHIDGVRKHHQQDRENVKSKCITPGTLNKDQIHEEEGYEKDLEDIFKASLSMGPGGDSRRDASFKMAEICPNFSRADDDNLTPKVEHQSPVDTKITRLDLPFLDVNLESASGIVWDLEIASRGDESCRRNGEDSESTVMNKIASFVPKPHGGCAARKSTRKDRSQSSKIKHDVSGKVVHVTGDLPGRVDAWLAANETERLDHDLERSHHHHHSFNYDNDHLPSDGEVEINIVAPKVTLGQSDKDNLVFGNERKVSEKLIPQEMKPRPSSSGPQRSKHATSLQPKSSVSKSRTSQLIDQPMYNRRWATSSSTWGNTKRSTAENLQAAEDQRSSGDAARATILVLQRKRPSSAKTVATEQGLPERRTKPKSADRSSRGSKEFDGRDNGRRRKQDFLSIQSAENEDPGPRGHHTSILPLTLQLIYDSPRGDRLSVWELLPDEILLHVFSYLSHNDLISCAACCSRYKRIAMDDCLWRSIQLMNRRQLTDFQLTQIGDRHPVSLVLLKCHGQVVTENGLRNLFRSCAETLQELNVSGCTGGELTGDSLLLHASRCHNLTVLDASWCHVTDNGLSAINDACQRLTSLCLNGCQSVSDDCLNRVVNNHGKSLEVLEVLGCLQLSPETLQSIGTECRSLHTLNIGQCYKVTDDCISKLTSHLRNLKHLDLRGCKQIRDSCVRTVVRTCKLLKTLVLANCSHISNAAVVEIATYLPTIASLDVSGCKKVDNEGVRSLATCCYCLNSLDASSTGINHKSVSALANYCNKTLTSLRLNCCKDITEKSIVKLLKNCQKLKNLHLYGVKGLRNLAVLKLQYPCLQFE